jgi:hypothetical protein
MRYYVEKVKQYKKSKNSSGVKPVEISYEYKTLLDNYTGPKGKYDYILI